MTTEDAAAAERDVDPTGISAAEDTGWRDLHALIDALTPEQRHPSPGATEVLLGPTEAAKVGRERQTKPQLARSTV